MVAAVCCRRILLQLSGNLLAIRRVLATMKHDTGIGYARLAGLCVMWFTALVLSCCTGTPTPTEQLLNDGYYYYSLGHPVNSSGDWDTNVIGFYPAGNCLDYRDSNEPGAIHLAFINSEIRVDLNISPDDPIWDPRPTYATVTTSVTWSRDGLFEYYLHPSGSYVAKIVDTNGMDVVIASYSFTQLSQVTEFVDSLDLVTPPSWNNHNPWECGLR